MMFGQADVPLMADKNEAHFVKRCLRRPLTSSDILKRFGKGFFWITMVKVVRKANPMGEKFYEMSRTYILEKQRDEITMDLFDISHSHRIIGAKGPWNIYLMECDSKHPNTNIDANLIEAIVGKVEG